MGALKNFQSPWVRPRLLLPKFFLAFLSRSILWMSVQNLKFVALPIPEIIMGTQKIGQSLDMPTLPFSQIFNGLLFWRTLWMGRPNLQSVIFFTRSWYNSDCSFELGLRTPKPPVPLLPPRDSWVVMCYRRSSTMTVFRWCLVSHSVSPCPVFRCRRRQLNFRITQSCLLYSTDLTVSCLLFLADRTARSIMGCPSVCLSVCDAVYCG